MTTETRKAAVRRYYEEIWNHENLALIDELMASDYANLDPATPGGVVRGRDGMKGLVSTYRAAFPDLSFAIEEQIGEGNVVVTRWTATGTQRGELMGLPATGLHASVAGITISRFAGEQIAVDQVVWDTLGLLRQLGGIPDAAVAAA